MKSFIILFTINLLLLFIVLMSTVEGGWDNDHDQWAQNLTNELFYGSHTHHSTDHGYYGQPSAGGYNNFFQSGGFHQQPPPYGYAHQSNFHPYNHNQPPPGNYGLSQSALHNHQQSTPYSNDSYEEETHRPAAGSSQSISAARKQCADICKGTGFTNKDCMRINTEIKSESGEQSLQCRCQWKSGSLLKRGKCFSVV